MVFLGTQLFDLLIHVDVEDVSCCIVSEESDSCIFRVFVADLFYYVQISFVLSVRVEHRFSRNNLLDYFGSILILFVYKEVFKFSLECFIILNHLLQLTEDWSDLGNRRLLSIINNASLGRASSASLQFAFAALNWRRRGLLIILESYWLLLGLLWGWRLALITMILEGCLALVNFWALLFLIKAVREFRKLGTVHVWLHMSRRKQNETLLVTLRLEIILSWDLVNLVWRFFSSFEVLRYDTEATLSMA